MSYVVLGANGHIGNNITRYLIEQNLKVKIVVRNKDDAAIKDLPCKKYIGSVSDKEFLNTVIEKDDIVINCIGLIDITNKLKEELFKVNVEYTKIITDLCILKQVSKLIYISTTDCIKQKSGIIKEPTSFINPNLNNYYAQSKALGSEYVLQKINSGLINGVILCPSCVIGINDYKLSLTGRIIKDQTKKNIACYLKGSYNFIDVENLCKAVYQASIKDTKPVYLLTGELVTIKDLLLGVFIVMKKKPKMIYIPNILIKLLMGFISLYYKITKTTPALTKMSLDIITSNNEFDNTLAKNDLLLDDTFFLDTLSKTINWYFNN